MLAPVLSPPVAPAPCGEAEPLALATAAMLTGAPVEAFEALLAAGVVPNVGTAEAPAVTLGSLRDLDLSGVPPELLSLGAFVGQLGALARLRSTMRRR